VLRKERFSPDNISAKLVNMTFANKLGFAVAALRLINAKRGGAL
jgi:hypothetical protein